MGKGVGDRAREGEKWRGGKKDIERRKAEGT